MRIKITKQLHEWFIDEQVSRLDSGQAIMYVVGKQKRLNTWIKAFELVNRTRGCSTTPGIVQVELTAVLIKLHRLKLAFGGFVRLCSSGETGWYDYRVDENEDDGSYSSEVMDSGSAVIDNENIPFISYANDGDYSVAISYDGEYINYSTTLEVI